MKDRRRRTVPRPPRGLALFSPELSIVALGVLVYVLSLYLPVAQ